MIKQITLILFIFWLLSPAQKQKNNLFVITTHFYTLCDTFSYLPITSGKYKNNNDPYAITEKFDLSKFDSITISVTSEIKQPVNARLECLLGDRLIYRSPIDSVTTSTFTQSLIFIPEKNNIRLTFLIYNDIGFTLDDFYKLHHLKIIGWK